MKKLMCLFYLSVIFGAASTISIAQTEIEGEDSAVIQDENRNVSVGSQVKDSMRDERLRRVEERRGQAPGPELAWYNFLWGHYPQMIAEGTKKYFLRMAKDYGGDGSPVQVAFGPYRLYVLSDPEDVNFVLNDPKTRLKFKKGFMSRFVRELITGAGMASLERGQHWDSLHKYMLPYFMKVKPYFEATQLHSREFIERLNQKEGVFDLEREMVVFTMAGIAQSMLGAKMPDERFEPIVDVFMDILKYADNRITRYPFNWPQWFPTVANQTYFAADRKLRQLLAEMIQNDQNLQSKGEGENSLIRAFRKASMSPQSIPGSNEELLLTETDMVDQIRAVFFGGHETTAHLLTMAFYRLALNPQVRNRLVSELRTQLPEGLKSPDQLTQKYLPYLDSVIQEVLRLDSSVPAVPRIATEDINLRGYRIPAGSIVLTSIDAVHRLSTYWKDPETFDPDRFMPDTCDSHHPDGRRPFLAFIPFGAGDRSCIGRHFSLLEAKTFLVESLLQGQNFKLAPDADVESIIVCTTRLKEGLKVVRSQE